MRIIFIVFLLLSFCNNSHCQDSLFTRQTIETLCSADLHGRGYVKEGCNKAGNYLASVFKSLGLKPVNDVGLKQDFKLPVNTFPGEIALKINGRSLKPGADFLVSPKSPGARGVFPIILINRPFETYSIDQIRGNWLLIDTVNSDFRLSEMDLKSWRTNTLKARGLIFTEAKKLTWSVGKTRSKIPEITILKERVPSAPSKIEVHIKSKYYSDYRVSNVIAYIPGKSKVDSFIYVTAHYDHLGRMGKDHIFPGANDNASGVSMMLNIAQHYSKPENQPEYNILFIAFAGEEAGLLGSKFYTENALTPLERIRFLINLDLLGTGDDGLMVVNGSIHQKEYDALVSINASQKLLPEIRMRGKAANSDHYWFSERGVPAFFFYTLGGSAAYHDINDTAENLSLSKYRQVFELITEFIDYLQEE